MQSTALLFTSDSDHASSWPCSHPPAAATPGGNCWKRNHQNAWHICLTFKAFQKCKRQINTRLWVQTLEENRTKTGTKEPKFFMFRLSWPMQNFLILFIIHFGYCSSETFYLWLKTNNERKCWKCTFLLKNSALKNGRTNLSHRNNVQSPQSAGGREALESLRAPIVYMSGHPWLVRAASVRQTGVHNCTHSEWGSSQEGWRNHT